MSTKFEKYGFDWDRQDGWDELRVEFWMIQQGREYLEAAGRSLFFHYKEAQILLWPEDDHHRWSDRILKEILDNDITVLMGPGDSGKTYGMIKYALTDFWSFPDNTLFLVSSTDMRGLETRIWGWMKTLLNRAKDRYEWLPGNVLESQHAVTPETIDEDNLRGRSLNLGLICVPCLSSTGAYTGLGKFVGVKQDRLRHIGDEVQHMKGTFLDAYNNWVGKEDFKGVMSFNPIDPTDPGGIAAEPLEGWTSMPTPTKTTGWRSKFFNAYVLNLVGGDSPNFEYPQDQPARYKYLVGKKKFDLVRATHGKGSWQESWQCEGVMRPGMVGERVLNRELCRKHRAFDIAVWSGEPLTRIYALDPAYGGIDRCVGRVLEFGNSLQGKQVVKLYPPEIIPVNVGLLEPPEDQIAAFIYRRHKEAGVLPQNVFYDSFGRGTLGAAFAKLFGANSPVPVDSGMRPTKRPVRHDLYVEDERGTKRLKRCDEHYSKFVSELWFSVRESVESEQLMELDEETMMEGCTRKYGIVLGNKTEIETKDDYKERNRRSPDLFDTLAIGIEGCRQRGFKIMRIGIELTEGGTDDWMYVEGEEYERSIQDSLLTHQ